MGEMRTLKVLRQLLKEWIQPDDMRISWDIRNREEVVHAEEKFLQYLADGWIAFSDEPGGRKQIFKFNPELERIILLPPLGGG